LKTLTKSEIPASLWLYHFSNYIELNRTDELLDQATLNEEWEIFVQVHRDEGFWELPVNCPFSIEEVVREK
jgi:hypothetical protein